MERDAVLNMRVPKRVKEALQLAADRENRSMAGQAVHILEEWLLNQAYLKGAKKPRPAGR